mgnify:CR=1 FL=1
MNIKANIYGLLWALNATALISCSNEIPIIGNDETVDEGGVELKVSAEINNDLSTRVSYDPSGNPKWNWNVGDEIGIICTGYKVGGTFTSLPVGDQMSEYVNVPFKFSYNEDNRISEFVPGNSGAVFLKDAGKTYIFNGYYPFTGNKGDSSGIITLDTSTDQDYEKRYKYLTILYADGGSADATTKTLNFQGDAAFKHKMAKIRFLVYFDDMADRQSSGKHIFNHPDLGTGITPVYSETAQEYLNNCRLLVSGVRHKGEFKFATGEIKPISSVTPLVDWDLTDSSVGAELIEAPYTDASHTGVAGIEINAHLIPQVFDMRLTLIDKYGKTYTTKGNTSRQLNLESGKEYVVTMTFDLNELSISDVLIADWTEDATVRDPFKTGTGKEE